MSYQDLFERFAVQVLPLGVSDGTHSRFKSIARFTSARTGDAPFKGTSTDQIAFVVSGSAKLVAQASHGREQVVAFHFAGDLVSIPASTAHAYSLCALEDCELVYFPADEFMRLAEQESGMVAEVLNRSLQALERCREKTVALGRKTAQEKLAGFLVTMSDRIGTCSGPNREMVLPMSRKDIGDSLGLTIETVSRQFSELRSLGLIETQGRSGISLLKMQGLKERAGHVKSAA
ncbi:MAG: helix-turn-helix domain-containing protein [Pseudomonadota bacterium]